MPCEGTREAGDTDVETLARYSSSALLGEYALDSAAAESSSIIDEPGECRTTVRENRRYEHVRF